MTPALSFAAPFPGLANSPVPSQSSPKDKDLALGEGSWLAVLLAAIPVAWLAPAPLPGLAVAEESAAGPQPAAPVPGKTPALPPTFPPTFPMALPMAFGPRVLEPSLPESPDPALPPDEIPAPGPAIEAPKPSLVDVAQAPAPSRPGEVAPPLVAERVLAVETTPPPPTEPVRRPDPLPPAPEAFRLEVKWQPPATEPRRSVPPAPTGVAAEAPEKPPAPAKPDRPVEASGPRPVVAASPQTAEFPADGRPEPDPDPKADPAPPPAARRSAPLAERVTVAGNSESAEPAPPGNQMETPLRPVRLTVPVEAPAPPPAPVRSAAPDPPPPPPSAAPAELHGLERAIERAELRQSPQTSELNLWMRPEHLGKIAVRLIERAGVVEIAVRAENSLARGWLAEGLPTLFDRLHERGFETSPALRGAEARLDARPEDQPDGRRQQWRDGQKRRDHREAEIFSLEPGETS